MITNSDTNSSNPQRNLPDLTLRKEVFDFVYKLCGYAPIPAISKMLASDKGGFFDTTKYPTED